MSANRRCATWGIEAESRTRLEAPHGERPSCFIVFSRRRRGAATPVSHGSDQRVRGTLVNHPGLRDPGVVAGPASIACPVRSWQPAR